MRSNALMCSLFISILVSVGAFGCGGVRESNVVRATPTLITTPKSPATATPQPSPSNDPTPTPVPTTLPVPSPTPDPTPSPTPTPTPAPTPPPSTFPFPPYVTRLEGQVAAIEARDKKANPPHGATLFYGSSSIVNWKTLATDFPKVKTINHGFGGSTVPEAVYYVERLVLPLEPKTIVFYEGDNDLVGGLTVNYVLSGFQEFVLRVRFSLPNTRIIFIAIKPGPARAEGFERYKEFNRRLKEWVESRAEPNLVFIDAYDQFLGPDGKPRPELFLSDGVHLTAAGYKIWVDDLQPFLQNL